MSLEKKDPPGKDTMPNIVVKIIGSKYVRYVVSKPNVSPVENEAIDIMRQASEEFSALGDFESFKQRLQEVDQSMSGLVSSKEIACESHGVTISSQLLRAILNDINCSRGGQIRWEIFINLLKPSKKTNSLLQSVGEEKEDHSMSKQDSCNKQPDSELIGMSVADGGCPQNARPVSEPAIHFSEDRYSDNQQTWIQRFMKLENILRLCMNKDSGAAGLERTRSLIHKYNNIYQLSLSGNKIEDALRRFNSGQNILVEPLLLYLKEL